MRDIDYDELDRAMNQLIVDKKSAEETAFHDAQPAVSSQDSTVSQPDLKPVSGNNQINRPIPSLANRRGGKFMDLVSKQSVVHPASQDPIVAPVKPVDQKPAINPNEINKPNGPLISSFVPRTPKSNFVTKTATEASLESPKPEFELPDSSAATEPEPKKPAPFGLDRLHFGQSSSNTEVQPVVSPTKEELNEDDSDIDRIADDLNKTLGLKDEASESDDKNAVESPFLSDAKVEKRPLGAFSAPISNEVTPPASMAMENIVPDAAEANNQNEPENIPGSTDTPLPAELGSDLLSIESSGVARPVEKDVTPEANVTEIEPKTNLEATPYIDNASRLEKATADIDAKPDLTSTPIAPVIADANKQGKQDFAKSQSAPIYDNANTVNKALLQKSPKKKGGAIKVILWILLLVVLGVGAGALVYFLLLPNL